MNRPLGSQALNVSVGLAISLALFISSKVLSSRAMPVESAKIDQVISARSQQSFSDLISQAEQTATQLIQQTFANPAVTEVRVQVSGERNGLVAPLLEATISRSNWQATPNIQKWSQHFSVAKYLLGYAAPPSTASPTASPSPPSAPPQSPGRFMPPTSGSGPFPSPINAPIPVSTPGAQSIPGQMSAPSTPSPSPTPTSGAYSSPTAIPTPGASPINSGPGLFPPGYRPLNRP
jgi:hypothetical protein